MNDMNIRNMIGDLIYEHREEFKDSEYKDMMEFIYRPEPEEPEEPFGYSREFILSNLRSNEDQRQDHITLVVEQTNVSIDDATEVLDRHDGDIINAISEIESRTIE